MPFRHDLIACGMYTLDIAMSGMYFSMVRCLNYSGFAEDVYIIQYCDQIQVATGGPQSPYVSFFYEIFPLIDLKLQKMVPEDGGRSGSFFMEDNLDVINANHSSVRYGSCYKAHCNKDKRDLADFIEPCERRKSIKLLPFQVSRPLRL